MNHLFIRMKHSSPSIHLHPWIMMHDDVFFNNDNFGKNNDYTLGYTYASWIAWVLTIDILIILSFVNPVSYSLHYILVCNS